MRIAPAITLNSDPQDALQQWARRRSLPARVVGRARIVLLAAQRQQDKQIAAAMEITPKKVSRWRRRFLTLAYWGWNRMHPGPAEPQITASVARRVVHMTAQQNPPKAPPQSETRRRSKNGGMVPTTNDERRTANGERRQK